MTNEKHIKSMNTRQLAKFFHIFDCYVCPAKTYSCKLDDRYLYCQKNIEEWLKREKNQ